MKIHFEMEFPAWAKTAARVVAPLALLCVAGVALAAPKTFASNATLTTDDLNASFGDLNTRVGTLATTLGPSGSLTTTNVTASGNLTIGGTTDFGLRAQTACSYVSNITTDCTCASGEVAVSGGGVCNVGGVDGILMESRNPQIESTGVAGASWRVSCIDVTTHARFPAIHAFALCARVKSN